MRESCKRDAMQRVRYFCEVGECYADTVAHILHVIASGAHQCNKPVATPMKPNHVEPLRRHYGTDTRYQFVRIESYETPTVAPFFLQFIMQFQVQDWSWHGSRGARPRVGLGKAQRRADEHLLRQEGIR